MRGSQPPMMFPAGSEQVSAGQAKRPVRRGTRVQTRSTTSSSTTSSTTGFKNSSKFPKDMRPDHLKNDKIFDALSLETVTTQLAMWSQTKATQEATALKAKKSERNGNKMNTAVKMIKIEAGDDDSTTVFHKQRYALRPSVVGQAKIWANYPTHWPEVYYSVNLPKVGLNNQLGQKQTEFLNDRRSKIEIKMFAPTNANMGGPVSRPQISRLAKMTRQMWSPRTTG